MMYIKNFCRLLFLVLFLFIISRAQPSLAPINGIEWTDVTGTKEGYKDNQTNMEWITYKKEIPPGNWISKIKNDDGGMIYIKWKSDSNIDNERFRSIKLIKNNSTEILSYSLKNDDWKSEAAFKVKKGGNYYLNFIYSFKGTIWIAFPLNYQEMQGNHPEEHIQEIIKLDDLEKLVIQSIDLGGRKYRVLKDDDKDKLIINAYNFSIEPANEKNIIFGVILNNTNRVKILDYIFEEGIVIEGGKENIIERNTIPISAGYAIYAGNTTNNTFLDNAISSKAMRNDEPDVYFYRSDSNYLSVNSIENLYNLNVHYYLDESYDNLLTIHPSEFFVNGGYYELNESCMFNRIFGNNEREYLSRDNEKNYFRIGANSWKCAE